MKRTGGKRLNWREIKRRAPIVELMRETGAYSEGQMRGSDGVDCPEHPGHRHAKVYKRGNHLTCWAGGNAARDGKPISVIDWYAHHHHLSPEAAAEELADRYGVDWIEDTPAAAAAPAPVLLWYQQQWRTLLAGTGELAGAGEDWLHGARGFPRQYLRELAARKLVRLNDRLPAHAQDDPPEAADYRAAVGFPLWSLAPEHEANALDPELPAAVWWRFLDPPRGDDGKPKKDKRYGSAPAAFFTACTRDELARCSTVYVFESVLKGLAADVAMRGADLQARLLAIAGELAGDMKPDDRAKLETEQLRLRAELDGGGANDTPGVRPRWRHKAWISLLSISGAAGLVELLPRLFSTRTHRPSVRIALDGDKRGRAAAELACRTLSAEGWEVLLVPGPDPATDGAKDWDELLKKSSGADVRRLLAKVSEQPLLREHARALGTFRHRHGWQLWGETTRKDGDRVRTEDEAVADFCVRSVTRYDIHPWHGGAADRSVYAVHACTRSASTNGSYGIHEGWIAGDEFSKTEAWRRFGVIHAPARFNFYLSDCKDMVAMTRKIIPVIGLVRDPAAPGQFQLIDGNTRQRLNETYRQSISTPYDALDWRGEWAGAHDLTRAKADGRRVLRILGAMFGAARPVALVLAYWTLGTLCKVISRNYPHAEVIGQKGSGKSTLLRALVAAFGIHSTTLDDWATDYRGLAALSNHTFPVIADECSRMPDRRVPRVQGWFNQSFDAGENVLRYGSDQFPCVLAASLLLCGQDTISDNASKLLSLRITKADARAGKEPDIASIPRFPWGCFARWLLDVFAGGAAAADMLARWETYMAAKVPTGVGDRARFGACWARLLLARELVLTFLDAMPVAEPDDDPEVQAILRLMREAAGASMETGEALDMLRAYAAIVSAEPERHPVTVVHSRARDEAGAWIVPNAVLETLRQRGRSFAVRDPRRFQEALRAEGLFGAPPPEDTDAPWIGGYWLDGSPGRKKVRHVVNRRASHQQSYLVPAEVLDLFGIDFPDAGEDADGPADLYPGMAL